MEFNKLIETKIDTSTFERSICIFETINKIIYEHIMKQKKLRVLLEYDPDKQKTMLCFYEDFDTVQQAGIFTTDSKGSAESQNTSR